MRKRILPLNGIGLIAQHIASAGLDVLSYQNISVYTKEELQNQLNNCNTVTIDIKPLSDNCKNNRCNRINIKHYHDNRTKIRKFKK